MVEQGAKFPIDVTEEVSSSSSTDMHQGTTDCIHRIPQDRQQHHGLTTRRTAVFGVGAGEQDPRPSAGRQGLAEEGEQHQGLVIVMVMIMRRSLKRAWVVAERWGVAGG